MAGDVASTNKLKCLLTARDDYEKLTAIETTFCKELDVKVFNLLLWTFFLILVSNRIN